ncbi:hypothetical protein A1Q1_05348 [Trichosporon asahii var. asahii CBS 2479]|uniref:Uncharacterized protein n=1 Tax=Trichosporon asahii var. asahii (strain ATCC 90039 / CBS 2479 / JCM 2466 / KCTC 7840 / NBRC 103889/ NCYC 2677 / UAMH 7654) TaxID=1186058 RepID=J6ETQ1_TRIAS|nr:hypothetical protein A1Q1_05348 [Trichosporon asahii var. asahii CBS 2479]EJT46137.1 hypothetical protein A1Q1_05348 [Trichosporon asahii var. asahii CBS 2479]
MTTTRSRSASFASSVSSSSNASDADVQVEVDEINDEAEVLSATQQPLRYRRMQARATAHRNPEEERLRHAVGGGLVASMKAGPKLEQPRSHKRAAWWTRVSGKVARAGGWKAAFGLGQQGKEL